MGLGLGPSDCAPGANAWVEANFHDCIYTTREAVSFGLGLTSIVVWILAQLPQFLDNIKNESAEALSVWFLAQWFLGDTLNLLGCLVQGMQLPTTTFLAMYFVVSDVIMLVQFIYYGAVQKRRAMQRQVDDESRSHHRRHRLRGHSAPISTAAGGVHHHHHHHHHSHSSTDADRCHSLPLHSDPHVHKPRGDEEEIASGSEVSILVQIPSSLPNLGSGRGSARPVAAVAGAVVSMLTLAAYGTAQLHQRQRGGGTSEGLWAPGMTMGAGGPVASLAMISGSPSMSGGGGSSGMTWGEPWSVRSGCDPNSYGDEGMPWWCDASAIQLVAGTALGYVSTVMYLSSRVSQIAKNTARKSAEGLSLIMFLMTVTANCCTGFSILLRLGSVDALKQQLPWLAGAFGTVGLDITIAWQARTYQMAAAAVVAAAASAASLGGSPTLSTPLLSGEGA